VIKPCASLREFVQVTLHTSAKRTYVISIKNQIIIMYAGRMYIKYTVRVFYYFIFTTIRQ
jgi:hypothetical protein